MPKKEQLVPQLWPTNRVEADSDREEKGMDATVKEIAAVLHSTETMAAQFASRVQARVNQPVSNTEILAVMKKMSIKSLSMDKVTKTLQRQLVKKQQ